MPLRLSEKTFSAPRNLLHRNGGGFGILAVPAGKRRNNCAKRRISARHLLFGLLVHRFICGRRHKQHSVKNLAPHGKNLRVLHFGARRIFGGKLVALELPVRFFEIILARRQPAFRRNDNAFMSTFAAPDSTSLFISCASMYCAAF